MRKTTPSAWGLSRNQWGLSPFLVALLTACSASLPPIDAEKLPPTPEVFREGASFTVAAPAEAQPRGEWWKAFSDPVLDELIERAERGNSSIRVAAARLTQARAFVRATDAARAPQVDVGASAARAGGIVNGVGGPARSLFTAGADLSYEADLFGRLRQASDAARLDADASQGLLQSTWLLVQAEVAQTYIALRALDAERALVRSTVAAYRQTLSLTERPHRVGVAKAAWFPSIALTARAGYASPDLSDLFKWSSRAWGLGLLGALPVFDGGRRKAGIEAAGADFEIAVARYREQVLVAFRDVEDQLAALRLLADQAEAQQRAVASASRSTALSEVRYRNGYVSQLDLLDAQRSELRNRREALQVRSAQYLSTVALVRALGGGWN